MTLLEQALEGFPKNCELKNDFSCRVRPLESRDEVPLLEFFQAVPETERMFIKHHVHDPLVIKEWCQNIDYDRNLPLLAFSDDQVIAACTLHQQLGGWKRHIGRVSVLVHPLFRGRGVARYLVEEVTALGRQASLEKLEAEFIAEQDRAIKMFSLLGYSNLLSLPDYVKDMKAINHDYVLMGLELTTDEEYAGMG